MFFFRKKEMDYIDYFKSLPSIIIYTDDHEYRNCIRTAFRFDPNEKFTFDGKIVDMNQLDDITKDEVLMDCKSISSSMDRLYNSTKDQGDFKDLYIKAAGRMFSTNPEIGQAVLCSYDTFHLYYACVWYYLNGGTSALLCCGKYDELRKYFNS